MDPSTIVAEVAQPGMAASLVRAWEDLLTEAAEPNAFYNPESLLSALARLPERRGAALLVAWAVSGGGRRLVGLLPIVRPRGRFFNPLPIRRAAACYGTLSTPLLHRDVAAPALSAMLRACQKAGIVGLALPFIDEDGPVAAALAAVVGQDHLQVVQLGAHRRGLLQTALPFEAYYRETLDGRRRKDAERRRRRLAEHGALAFRVVVQPEELPGALERFLALEAAGWKGRRGTAMAQLPDVADFVRDLVAAGAPTGRTRIAELLVDGRPVASGIILTSGRRAFFFKTAYDEALARFSPGFALTLDLTKELLADPTVDSADSIAVADHPMIDRLWTAKLAVASILIATGPGASRTFRLAVRAERWRQAVWDAAAARWRRWRDRQDSDG